MCVCVCVVYVNTYKYTFNDTFKYIYISTNEKVRGKQTDRKEVWEHMTGDTSIPCRTGALSSLSHTHTHRRTHTLCVSPSLLSLCMSLSVHTHISGTLAETCLRMRA